MTVFRCKKLGSLLILVLIILLGAILRLYRLPELSTFRSDQVIELTSTADILRGDFTLIGIKTSNSEVRNGAVMYYLMAPFLLAMKFSPLAGALVQILLSLGTIVLVYATAKKFFVSHLALLAAFSIATSSLLVQFSRQTLLAYYPLFFSALFLCFALKVIKKSSLLTVGILGTLCGFSLQVHYATLALFVCALFLPALFKAESLKETFIYWGSLFLGLFLGLAPMLLFEIRNEFFNSKMLWNYVTESGGGHEGFNLLNYLVNSLAQYFFGGSVILTCVAIIVLVYTLMRVRKSLGTLEKLCLLQLGCVFLFIIFLVHEDIPHYLLPAVPSLVLLTGRILAKTKNPMLSKFLAVGLAVVFFLINIPHYRLADSHGWTMAEGWNLVGVEKAARIIASDLTGDPFNVAMIVDQENQGLPLRYFLHVWGYSPLPVESYDKAHYLYVLAEPGTVLSQVTMWEVTAFGSYEVSKSWPIQNGFILYKLEKADD